MARTAGIGPREPHAASPRAPGSVDAPPDRPQTSLALDRRDPPVARSNTAPVVSGTAPAVMPPTSGASGPASPWFNPRVLAVALAADPLGPSQQAVVRDQLRLLLGKYGAADRDIPQALPRATHFKVARLLPFNGAHSPDGLIQLSATAHREAVRFLNGARDRAAIAGIGTLVHEGLHGHSPIGGRWGDLDEAAQRIDHLAVSAAAQAIVVREFNVAPAAVTTNVPYGVDETIGLIARHTGRSQAAARNVLYDAALQYFGAGPLLHTGLQVEERFMFAVQLAAGKTFEQPLRRHLGSLP